MTTYELPDGFEGMDSLPRGETVNLVTVQGRFTNGHWDSGDPVSDVFIGWSPVVPPKKKRRFVVVENAPYGGWGVMFKPNNAYVAYEIQTRESAQAVADIYEQAYEVTP